MYVQVISAEATVTAKALFAPTAQMRCHPTQPVSGTSVGHPRTGTASQSATQCFCTNYDLRLAPVVLQPLTPDKPSLDMKAHDSFCSSCERVSPQ